MPFGKRVSRIFKRDNVKDYDKEQLDTEKGDLPAMIFASLAVYFPVVLLFGGLMLLLAWLLSSH